MLISPTSETIRPCLPCTSWCLRLRPALKNAPPTSPSWTRAKAPTSSYELIVTNGHFTIIFGASSTALWRDESAARKEKGHPRKISPILVPSVCFVSLCPTIHLGKIWERTSSSDAVLRGDFFITLYCGPPWDRGYEVNAKVWVVEKAVTPPPNNSDPYDPYLDDDDFE
jgi:hypothetical protein